MKYIITALSLIIGLALSLIETIGADEGTWSFRPQQEKNTRGKRLLDLRSLNEKQSGESGFIRLSKDGNSFVRGDGQPIRFWAIGSDIYRKPRGNRGNPKPKDEIEKLWQDRIDRHCRFLARMGVNMVRLHATVAAQHEGAAITDVNKDEIEGIFRFIKAAKANGIYVTISPYYGHHETPKSWKLDGYTGKRPWGALFIDPRMQEGYCAWTRALYTTKNPHTGLAIKDDPTVAILQIHNEDSLFFWTAQRLPEPQQKRLARAFGGWLTKKYGSLKKALATWNGKREKGDDLKNGLIALYSTWHMTQDWKGPTAKRMRDQTQFLAEFQRDFYAHMGKYLRKELGCRQLLNATNWRTANDMHLKEIERWTYGALDIDAENEYFGPDYHHIGKNNGYRIDPGHKSVNVSCLKKPLQLTTNFKSHVGHPFIVTETSWKHPNLYQAEGPFLISAYQSLGGVDAVYWFSANEVEWLTDPRRLFWKVGDSYALDKWSCSTPMLMGMFPAASLVYRNGYLKEGDTVVTETRGMDALWRREPPAIDDFEIYGVSHELEECGKVRRKDGRISRAAFLVGPVHMKFGKKSSTKVSDFGKYLDPKQGTIRSNTGQLKLNYKIGLCTMNAPQAQGVTGFLKDAGGKFQLADTTIQSKNDYAAISVVSLDKKPLSMSRRIFVQVGTTARLKGWKTKPVVIDFKGTKIKGQQIVNTGRPPWQIRNTKATVTINNKFLNKAHKVIMSGRDGGEIRIVRKQNKCTVQLPSDAMYVVLTSE